MKKIIIVALVLLAVGGGVLYVLYIYSATTVNPAAEVPHTVYTPSVESGGENGSEYRNTAFGFALDYPKELQVREYQEANSALSVVFEDPDDGRGLQVYVTPYGDTQITDERFKADQPSGVMQEPTDVLVSGARATMFFGRNEAMGDTREVWFIHNGFLYEVATYKALDAWFAEIMQTWKFLSND